jgi:hypothetical protein
MILLLEPDNSLASEYLKRIAQLYPDEPTQHFLLANKLVDYIDDNPADVKNIKLILELQCGVSNALELLAELSSHDDSESLPVLLTGYQQVRYVAQARKNFPNIVDYYIKTGGSPVKRFDASVTRLMSFTP